MTSDAHASRRSEPPVLRALVVDDDENYASFVAALLRRAEIAADTARDGEEALTVVRSREPYDLFLIDYEMPRMNGLELIRKLREEKACPGAYAVMITARTDVEAKVAALTSGFDDYLIKASTELELVAKIAASKRLVVRQQTLDASLRALRGLVATDELTGLFTRRFFFEEAPRLLKEHDIVSIVLLDLDDFKAVNDTYGHLVGDQVLRDVGRVLRSATRYHDFVTRFGGDEFVMMAPKLGEDEVDGVVRRISAEVEALRWEVAGREFGIGVTSGIATTRLLQARSLEALLDAADRDLYKNKYVKKAGEDRTSYDYGRPAPGDVIEFPEPLHESRDVIQVKNDE